MEENELDLLKDTDGCECEYCGNKWDVDKCPMLQEIRELRAKIAELEIKNLSEEKEHN